MADPEPESETALLEHSEWIEFHYIGIYVTSFLVLVGTVGAVGNIHVLLVYFKWMRHTTYRVFVMTLSLTDLLGSTLSIAFIILELRHPLLFTSSELCKVSRMVIYFVATFSLCLLDIISLERLWLICRPLGYRTGTTAAIFICLVCAACTFCLVSIPAALIYGSDQRPTSFPTLVGCECTVTGYLRRPILGVVYQTALAVLFTFLLFICITTYGYIYWKLKRVMLNDSTLRVHSLHHYNRHYHGGDRAATNTTRSNRSESIVELTIVSETSETSEHSEISTTPTECAKEIYDRTTLDEKYLEISPDLGAEKESDASFHNVKNKLQTNKLSVRNQWKYEDGPV
ncbi:uncharacterized protein LOC110462938 [Mizuhopecten yessoensis]|uniref:uncharacterized protein LOC110462938 n=1 Tax=Mizuhopecten yessoensis TaxID=6573 RepID=UPI000B45BBB2|nr:uncharacterized protein LOC110462938 [Mizuhopecten yessoensis]